MKMSISWVVVLGMGIASSALAEDRDVAQRQLKPVVRDVHSQRSDVLSVLSTSAPELVNQNGEMVSDWQAKRSPNMSVEQVLRVPSDQAAMGVEFLETVTFWDEDSRYDLILDQDGALVLDVLAQRVSDSFAFTVGPVPTIKNPSKVHISALGVMARKGGDSGIFNMDVDDLTVVTINDALAWSDAASVFVDSGTVVALFYIEGEVELVLQFSPQDKDISTRPQGLLLLQQRNFKKLVEVCNTRYKACVKDENVSACGHWLDHCQYLP